MARRKRRKQADLASAVAAATASAAQADEGTAATAKSTAGARTQLPSDWIQPWWRATNQFVDASMSQTAELAATAAQAGRRSWTLLGSLDGSHHGCVDRRGLLVSNELAGWSVDWWFKAGADWVFPSQRSGVQQQLINNAPVVETAVRVGQGEVRQRAFVARPTSGGGGSADETGSADELVVEITNDSNAPIAVALAVRPYDLQGAGHIEEISVVGGQVQIGGVGVGVGVLQADRLPGEVVFGSEGVDPARVLAGQVEQADQADQASQASQDKPAAAQCSLGLASVALVFPLVHGSVLRAALPLGVFSSTNGGTPTPGISNTPPTKVVLTQQARSALARLPAGNRVAAGWRSQSDSALTARLGSGQLSTAFEAAKTSLPLAIRGGSVNATPFGPATSTPDETLILTTAAEMSYSAAVADVLIERGQMAGRRGDIQWAGRDVTASTLIAAAALLTLHPDAALTKAYAQIAADGARWLLAQIRTSPAGSEPVDGSGTLNAAEVRRGLQAALELLDLAAATKAAKQLRLSLKKLPAVAKIAAPLQTANRPASPAANQAASQAASQAKQKTSRAIHGLLIANAQGEGNNLLATARQALQEITSRQPIGVRRLDALLVAASNTWSWPTIKSPAARAGPAPAGSAQASSAVGAGHDLRITTYLLRCVRAMLMTDTGPSSAAGIDQPRQLSIACVWPDAWLGEEVEVHNMAARCGNVSWAIRWHGRRPALLWEITPHEHSDTSPPAGTAPSAGTAPQPGITLTAPGIDRTFISHAWEGETLLAAPARSAGSAQSPGSLRS